MQVRMRHVWAGALKGAATGTAVALLLAAPLSGTARAAGAFAGLAGTWSGTGTVSLSDGSKERIRCTATYQVDSAGISLHQTLRCSSDNYNFDLGTDLADSGGSLSGQWTEHRRGVGGNIYGRGREGQMQVRAETNAYAVDLTLSTRADRQTVTLKTSGGDIAAVNITLSRGK
jgi:hypothetical protein